MFPVSACEKWRPPPGRVTWFASASSAPRWLISEKSPETRQITLAEYCHSLVNLPPHISRSRHLADFLAVRPEDENPAAPNA